MTLFILVGFSLQLLRFDSLFSIVVLNIKLLVVLLIYKVHQLIESSYHLVCLATHYRHLRNLELIKVLLKLKVILLHLNSFILDLRHGQRGSVV